jgi:hypothetical protein
MNKKGQAALEFLTTYGWAFLVILVMIGALAYFGVLDPTRYLPQRCQFGAEMHCDRFALDSNGTANFELRNALPTDVFISTIEWDNDGTWEACDTTSTIDGVNTGTATTSVFKRERTADFRCEDNDMGSLLSAGDKYRLRLRLTYNEGSTSDPNYAKYLQGEIYANVRE